jgi:hypothetical protein
MRAGLTPAGSNYYEDWREIILARTLSECSPGRALFDPDQALRGYSQFFLRLCELSAFG